MQQPRSRKHDVNYEAALQQWWQGVRLDDIARPKRVEKFAETFRVARWVWLVPTLTLAFVLFARRGTGAFPGALWLPAVQLLIIALVAAYLRYYRWQEARRTARLKMAEESGEQARRRIWRRDRFLSTRAYHTLQNFELSRIGLMLYAAYVTFGGSGLILLHLFGLLEGHSNPQDTMRVILLAYPGMLLTCCPIGGPAFLLWVYCRSRLRSWQRLEDNDPERAEAILWSRE